MELRLGDCSPHAAPLPCQLAVAAAPAQRGIALELAEAMAGTASPLRAVSLVGGGIDDEALPALIAAVEQCTSLARLDLRHCFLSKGAAEALQLAAAELRRRQVLYLLLPTTMAYTAHQYLGLGMAYHGLLWLTSAFLGRVGRSYSCC